MDYGNILSRAWKITWNNKILWLFGFLAGSTSFTPRGDSGGGGGDGGGNFGGPDFLPPEVQRQLEQPEIVAIILAVACVLLLIGLAFFILSIIARGGLVGGIRLADDALDRGGKVTFGEAWAIGLRYFWRTLGMTLMLIAPAIVFGLVVAGVAIVTFGLGVLCLLPLICIFAILYIPYSAIIWLGQIGVVVDDLGVFDGVKKGWELLKTNIGPVFIIGLILFVIGFVIGFALLVPLVFIAAPAFLAFVANPDNPNVPLIVGSVAAFLCFLPVLWVLSGVINTWIYSVWTLAYRQLTGNAPATTAPQPPAPDNLQPA